MAHARLTNVTCPSVTFHERLNHTFKPMDFANRAARRHRYDHSWHTCAISFWDFAQLGMPLKFWVVSQSPKRDATSSTEKPCNLGPYASANTMRYREERENKENVCQLWFLSQDNGSDQGNSTYGRASERSHCPLRPVSLSAETPLQGHFPCEPPPLYSKCK